MIDTGNEGVPAQYPSTPPVKQNELTIDALGRYDQGAVYTCQASNSVLSPPVSASVTIEMFRKYLNWQAFFFAPSSLTVAIFDYSSKPSRLKPNPPAVISGYECRLNFFRLFCMTCNLRFVSNREILSFFFFDVCPYRYILIST